MVVVQTGAPAATPRASTGAWLLAAAAARVRIIGGMAALAITCARAMLKPSRRQRAETIRQSHAILRAALPAAMLSIAALGFAGPGLQAGNFLVYFCSIRRSGCFIVVSIVP